MLTPHINFTWCPLPGAFCFPSMSFLWRCVDVPLIRDKTILMKMMKSFRSAKNGRWSIPTIIVQQRASRYSPPQNPLGYLQIMQAINVSDDQVYYRQLSLRSVSLRMVVKNKMLLFMRVLSRVFSTTNFLGPDSDRLIIV